MRVRRKMLGYSLRTLLAGALVAGILYLDPTHGVWKRVHHARKQAAPIDDEMDSIPATPLSLRPAARESRGAKSVEIAAANTALWEDVRKPATASSGDRWARFEGEYGIKDESSSAVGRMIQTAKYGLDTACFAALEGAKELEFTHDFGEEPESGTGEAEPDYSMPMVGRLGHAQLQSEVTVHDPNTGEAFVGLKLAIPFGPGLGRSSEVPRSRLDLDKRDGQSATQ